MLLGKRPRPPMKRTTSMNEITVDLNSIGTPLPSDPQTPKDREISPHEASYFRRYAPADAHDVFDCQSPTATVSPRYRRTSGELVETANFLRACGLCKRRLGPGRDIFIYKGESAFCSLECRQQQMNQDERKEKCSMASIKKDASAAVGSESSSNGETVVGA
eukprot:TRINITY_DN2273_c0_g1_i1.p1 TRINITY_DN2273_c0_g1~~TRINITY_DN2273_c0_g1_i1.p1  ORF type:complete len:162 (+),score=6.79 TRINITY_DN2273_c0_g1_i1:80-565(+)